MYKGGLILTAILQLAIAVVFFTLNKSSGMRFLYYLGAGLAVMSGTTFLAFRHFNSFKKGKRGWNRKEAIVVALIGLFTTLIGGVLIIAGLNELDEEGNKKTSISNNKSKIKEHKTSKKNRVWISNDKEYDKQDGRSNEYDDLVNNRRSYNEYDDIVNGRDVRNGYDFKNQTMKELNAILSNIDYNHYTNLYIKSNPDWKNSENNSIEKLADAIAYRHLIKMLKDQNLEYRNMRGENIDKVAEQLIFEKEQDYDVIIQSVIKRIDSELDGM